MTETGSNAVLMGAGASFTRDPGAQTVLFVALNLVAER